MVLQSLGTRLTYHYRKTYYEYVIKNLAVNPDYYWLDEWDKTEMYNSIKKSSHSFRSIWVNMFDLIETGASLTFYMLHMVYIVYQKVEIFNRWTIPLFLIPIIVFFFKRSMLDDITDNNEMVNKLTSKNINMFNMLDDKFIHGQHDVLIETLDENFKAEMTSTLDVNYRITKHDDILRLVNNLFTYICITVVLYTGNFSSLSDFITTCTKLLAIVTGVSYGVSGLIKKLSDLSKTVGDYLMTDLLEKQIEKQRQGQLDKKSFNFDNDFALTFENIHAELVRKDENGAVTNRFVLEQTEPLQLCVGKPMLINGNSGCGKSTLLKVMSGLKKPISIDLRIDHYESLQADKLSLDLQTNYSGSILGICDHIIYCRQDSLSFIKGTLYEIVTGKKKSMIVDEDTQHIHMALKLSHVDFTHNDEVIHHSSVSGGQRARLTIANIMYNILTNTKKPIIFLDEIDKGLNPQLAVDIYKSILENFSKDHVIVVISHFDEVKRLFNRSIAIENGMIGGMINRLKKVE